MKFKFGILAFVALALFSCDPLADSYELLDEQIDPNAEVVKTYDEYVLTAADYASISKAASAAAGNDAVLMAAASAVAEECALNEYVTKDVYIPAIIEGIVPTWQNGSVFNATYNYSAGLTDSELAFVGIENISVSDYGWDYKYYAPSHSPEDNIPALLAAKYPGSDETSRVVVEYWYSSQEPVVEGSEEVKESYDFAEQVSGEAVAIEGWQNIALVGDNVWVGKEYSENQYVQMSAFGAEGDTEAWLVMPLLSVEKDMYITFDMKFGYPNGGSILQVMVSESYDGENIDIAQWDDITSEFSYPELPESGYSADWESVGLGMLTNYVGKDVYVAFRYDGNSDSASTTVQIDNLKVATGTQTIISNEAPTNALYKFNGSIWKVSSESYNLIAPADYDAMGAPGSYDNFSSTTPASNYIPAYLAQKHPYALVGDTEIAIYKMYGSTTPIDVDEYIFDGNAWSVNTNISVCEKETFIKADAQWMFDPTILYSVTNEDYTYIVEWTAENKPAYVDASYGNTEYWYGASYHYNNFNVQLVKRRSNDPEGVLADLNDAAAIEYCDQKVFEAISEHILPRHFASVATQDATGGDQIILVDCLVYNDITVTYSIEFKVLGGGEFEFVSLEIK